MIKLPRSSIVLCLLASITSCKKGATDATDKTGSGIPTAPTATPTNVAPPDDPTAPEPEKKKPAGYNTLTLKVTGGYTAERTIANSATATEVVMCMRAATIFSILHSGDATSGDGSLASFQVSTPKYKGAGTYAFDDDSASLAFVDMRGEKLFSEDASRPEAQSGTLTINADGVSGSFKIKFAPGGDPPTSEVEVTGTFTCPEIAE